MNLFRKLGLILGVKGVLCLVSVSMIVMALVTYSATVTMTPTQQFTIGASSASWAVYVNDVNKVRYLPGGASEPTFNAGDPNTYGFQVVTDVNQNCSIKIELTTTMNSSKFSNFNIAAKYWTGAAWADVTLYTAAIGSTTKSYIDGLVQGDAGYIQQGTSIARYYLIKVTYSYDKVDETALVTATFQYTPLP